MIVPKVKEGLNPLPFSLLTITRLGVIVFFLLGGASKRTELQLVGEASDGMEVVHRAKQRQPKLILLDIIVPTLNGIDAAAESESFLPAKFCSSA